MTFIPRKNQIEGVQALIGHEGRFSVAECCVASGKSAMMGMLSNHYMRQGRVLNVAHNKELVQQNADACRLVGINPGICSSSLATNAFARTTVGTIGSVINRVHLFKDVVAINVDEVHRVPPAESSQYRKLFAALPDARVHGLSGTVFRADGTGGLERTFGPVVYKYTFLDGLRDKIVKPLVPVPAGEDEEIDVEGLKTTTVEGEREFDLKEQASRAIKLLPSHSKTMRETMEKFQRRRAIVFCCNIEHVDKTEAALRAVGINAVGVHSKSPSGRREKAVAAFKAGLIDALVSCEMFTTGFDCPHIDIVVWMRATKSGITYAQGMGRGARLTPYAYNCAVLDFGGNLERHGALDVVAAAPGRMLECDDKWKGCGERWETWENGKTCPSCGELHKSAPKCKGCQEKFDPHFHGMVCPHCGTRQGQIKECAACGEAYAAFLHPICPHCQYDNTVLQDRGKELKTRGSTSEAVSAKIFIEQNPWQQIISPPVWYGNHWVLTTMYATTAWKYSELPDATHVYLKRAQNGRYIAEGVYGRNGQIYRP